MPLTPGTRLGPYEVISAIGAGGMGEVYRATDTKLKRHVAIKILPPTVAADHDRLARFRREAEVLASLNHPNIAAIYGLEECGGVSALVMELVEGEDLSQRMSRGPIPIDEALPLARQIAEALEAAHEQGIIHRDLKPANIKVRSDGTAKVLDFGLAKALEPVGGTAKTADSPTITSPATTQAGMILGTAAYMSPEQARGRTVDHRSDIWAFGVVLYEMITGQRLFDGETMTDVLANVVKEEPDLSRTPTRVRKLLAACLEKDPRRRLHAIGDARLLLVVDAVAEPRSPWVPWTLAAGLALALGIALWAPGHRPAVPEARELSVLIAAPDNTPMWGILSPDGTRLFQLSDPTKPATILTLATGETRELPGTDRARNPFWSPDGRWLAFFRDGSLLLTPSIGGPVQLACPDTGDFFGGSWHPNGTVLVARESGPILAVRVANGLADGPCSPVQADSADLRAHLPEWLPDGVHFFFAKPAPASDAGVHLRRLDGSSERRVLPDVSSVSYLPPGPGEPAGHLFFRRGTRLMVQPFDPERMALSDEPVELASGVTQVFHPARSSASVSANGLLVYATMSGNHHLTWFDRRGRELERLASTPADDYAAVALSPDGAQVGVRRGDVLSIFRLADGVETRIGPLFSSLVFSPDGSWATRLEPDLGLVRQRVTGGAVETLVARPGARPSQWTPDKILFTDVSQARGDLWYLPNPGAPGSQPVQILATPASESQGQLSPDGNWLAYTSDEGGSSAVYVCRFPECTQRQRLPGTAEPRWNWNGTELFWLRGVGNSRVEVMAATVRTGTSFTYGPSQVLFEADVPQWTPELNFYSLAPSADGQRFLLPVRDKDSRYSMHLVTNWRRLLQQSAPR